jgi:hypothetical protein
VKHARPGCTFSPAAASPVGVVWWAAGVPCLTTSTRLHGLIPPTEQAKRVGKDRTPFELSTRGTVPSVHIEFEFLIRSSPSALQYQTCKAATSQSYPTPTKHASTNKTAFLRVGFGRWVGGQRPVSLARSERERAPHPHLLSPYIDETLPNPHLLSSCHQIFRNVTVDGRRPMGHGRIELLPQHRGPCHVQRLLFSIQICRLLFDNE